MKTILFKCLVVCVLAFISASVAAQGLCDSLIGTTQTISHLPNGDYKVVVTDVTSGCTQTDYVTIEQHSPLSISMSVLAQNNCTSNNLGSAKSFVSGGTSPYSNSWSNGAHTQTISGLANGTYTVTVTDAVGCTVSGSVDITSQSPLNISMSVLAQNTCTSNNLGSAKNFASGGTSPYSNLWSNGAHSQTISGLANGTYTVTVTDAAGCTVSDSVDITSQNNLNISMSVLAQNTCTSNNQGSAKNFASGGTSPYSNLWSNGAHSQTISGLANGTYTVTVTDAVGCTVSGSVDITSQNNLSISMSVLAQNTCTSNNQGSAKNFASGGTSPYSNLWSNGAHTQTISGLANGTYTVTVTDAVGCTISGSVDITSQALSINAYAQTQNTCNGNNAGVATVTANGVPPYSYTYRWYKTIAPTPPTITQNGTTLTSSAAVTYQWLLNGSNINGATGQTYVAQVSGAYQVLVTSSNGCSTLSDPVAVTVLNTGIEGAEATDAIRVFPNPAFDYLYVEGLDNMPTNTAIEIYNMAGALVWKGNGMAKVTIKDLPTGGYLVRIANAQTSVTRKFVKQ